MTPKAVKNSATELANRMLLLLILVADGQVFTQASVLKLRDAPNAKAKVVKELPIGTACTQRGDGKDGWVQLECAAASGYGKADLVSDKAPDMSVLLQGMRSGASTKDQLNATSRVLALAAQASEPDSELLWEAREQYRKLFYAAELESLRDARSKGKTLKGPPREQTLSADWSNEIADQNDFVHVDLLVDNEVYVTSGSVLNGTKTIEQTWKSSIDIGAVQALTAGKELNGCYAAYGINDKGGCEFQFDQNCSPDNCWDPFQDCKKAASTVCLSCADICGTTCFDCRAKCKGKSLACLESCGNKASACAEKCRAGKTKSESKCDGTYSACSAKEERWWKQNCEAACNKYRKCSEKKSDCPLKDECRQRCMF